VFERYNPRHLLEVIRPTQRERFAVGARGLIGRLEVLKRQNPKRVREQGR
jgi:hypothetical protein